MTGSNLTSCRTPPLRGWTRVSYAYTRPWAKRYVSIAMKKLNFIILLSVIASNALGAATTKNECNPYNSKLNKELNPEMVKVIIQNVSDNNLEEGLFVWVEVPRTYKFTRIGGIQLNKLKPGGGYDFQLPLELMFDMPKIARTWFRINRSDIENITTDVGYLCAGHEPPAIFTIHKYLKHN